MAEQVNEIAAVNLKQAKIQKAAMEKLIKWQQ